MGGFLTGVGCAVVIAGATYFGLIAFGVSSTERSADTSVKIERSLDFDSTMIPPTH